MGLCLLVAASGGAVTAGSVRNWYPTLVSPPGTPPNWLFGPVWTTLYTLIGVSGWLIWRQVAGGGPRGYAALRLWGWQLGLSALWPPVFFGLHTMGLALLVIVLLLGAIALTIRAFARIDRTAAAMLLPYAGWVLFATYLNVGFWWLNPS